MEDHGQDLSLKRFKARRSTFSPFLFLLVSDFLRSLLENVHAKGLFEGFIVRQRAVHISHLQFSDNTLLFCQDDDRKLELSS